jgi:hypothetical protein
MIALDTDVLAIHHVFNNDPRYEATEKFLAGIRGIAIGVTIFNLLELCGIISTARQREASERIFQEYLSSHDIAILFPVSPSQSHQAFWSDLTAECLARIHRGMRLGDAVILWTLESAHVETS